VLKIVAVLRESASRYSEPLPPFWPTSREEVMCRPLANGRPLLTWRFDRDAANSDWTYVTPTAPDAVPLDDGFVVAYGQLLPTVFTGALPGAS
jgi:hypothetical protein